MPRLLLLLLRLLLLLQLLLILLHLFRKEVLPGGLHTTVTLQQHCGHRSQQTVVAAAASL